MAFLRSFVPLLLLVIVLMRGSSAQTACRLDLAFVVDASGGVCDHDSSFKYERDTMCNNWNRIRTFLRDVVSRLSISTSDIRVAIVTHRKYGKIHWLLSEYSDKIALLNAIDKIPYEKGGETNIANGLTTLRDEVFGKKGDRPDAINRAVIITDGPEPSDTASIQDIINRLHGDGVTTLSVGIENDKPTISDVVLKLLSSQPKQLNVNYFKTKDFSSLGEVVNPLSSQLCQSVGLQANG